jgi:hypothetical protein
MLPASRVRETQSSGLAIFKLNTVIIPHRFSGQHDPIDPATYIQILRASYFSQCILENKD